MPHQRKINRHGGREDRTRRREKKMKTTKILNGNQTIAEAVRQIDPDVMPAYPLTLSTAAGLRLPIVAAIANRALSAPINIHGDHSDTMGARDSGWIQIYSEDCQEAYDNFIQAFRIGEHPDVLTPVLVGFDGFIISHSSEVVQVEDGAAVKKFIGEFKPPYPLLDTNRKFTVGPIDFTDYYFEHKRSQIEGIENSPRVIEEVGKEFGRPFGRAYGFFEQYRTAA